MRCRLYSHPCLLLRVDTDWFYLTQSDWDFLMPLGEAAADRYRQGDEEGFQAAYDLFEAACLKAAETASPAKWGPSKRLPGLNTIIVPGA